jgi:ectoine hydroxylase-related dioxygenase (phytanoyl-CoA dioxygenase family)
MNDLTKHHNNILDDGFTIIENIYTNDEIDELTLKIDSVDKTNPTFRKSDDLFAIRQFLKEVPDISQVIFNNNLRTLIKELFALDYFVVKSIYFDKPEKSNWFVGWHQDLTISVNKREDIQGYGPWTIKQDQFAVQPPIKLLEENFTIRIHLDNTDENNGALKVISGSHLKAIYRPENIDWNVEAENICVVTAGGVMIMKPLLLHASNRTTNNNKRRVIHIEFSKSNLPEIINWSEKLAIC